MAGETQITVVGNLVADPELRWTANGAAVANFKVASTPRTFDRQTNQWVDGEALFVPCSVWKEAAENVAESLTKGMRVIVQGRLKARSYEDREGNKRTSWELDVDEVGPALRFATAKVARAQRGGGAGPGLGDFGVVQPPAASQQGGGFGGPAQGGGFGGPPAGAPQGGPQQGGFGGPQQGGAPAGGQDAWSGNGGGGWDTPPASAPPF